MIQSFKIQSLHDVDEYITKDHGRIETRKCSVITDLKWIDEAPKWKGLKSIIKIDSQRETGNKIQNHTRYYIQQQFIKRQRIQWTYTISLGNRKQLPLGIRRSIQRR